MILFLMNKYILGTIKAASKLGIIAYSFWVLISSKVLTHLKYVIQSSQQHCEVGSCIIICVLQMGKLRHRK